MDKAVVYGKGETSGIVALDERSDSVKVWRRESESGELSAEMRPFYPMMWFEGSEWPCAIRRDVRDAYDVAKLRGNLERDHLVTFESMDGYWQTFGDMKQRAPDGSFMPDDVYLVIDPAQQYLMQTGETLFNDLRFDDLQRLSWDIEAYSAGGFPDPSRPEDEIIIIALADNEGNEAVLYVDEDAPFSAKKRDDVLFVSCPSEPLLIEQFIKAVRQLNPDVLTGHNVHDFDFWYVDERCDLHGIDFAIGRDGRTPDFFDRKKRAANRYIEYTACDVPGRHVIDTMMAAYDWNVYARELDSFGLKQVAQTLGVAPDDRTYVPGDKISHVWDTNPERLIDYAIDDVRETRELEEELSAALFEKAKIVPLSYGTLNQCGTGREIESMMVREYLRQGHSIPRSNDKEDYGGAYTAMFRQGVYGVTEETKIHNYDVASLYPYCQMGYECYPASDVLNVMPQQLEALTNLRIQDKNEMRSLPDGHPDKFRLDSKQDAEKVVINSFYGTLGADNFIFNDMEQAARIPEKGREVLQAMQKVIRDVGGHTLIESDTDGVWALNDGSGPVGQDLADEITDRMPEFIDIDLDAELDGLAMYRAKNYCKQTGDDLTFKGSAMTSSMFEPFGREFIEDGFRHMLNGEIQALHDLYVDTIDRIADREIPVEDLAKRETLSEPVDEYMAKIEDEDHGRTRDARYELAMSESSVDDVVGEQVVYYNAGDLTSSPVYENAKLIGDYDNDENVKYYVRKRMQAFAKKFRPFFTPDDADRMFPRPERGEVRVQRNDVSDVRLVQSFVAEPDEMDVKKL